MSNRHSKRKVRRRASRPVSTVFIDESGFTGPDLLDRDQPYVAYAAVAIDERRASEILKSSREAYRSQGGELKASTLLRRERGRAQVLEILQQISAKKMRVSIHEKRFALAAKFVEYIFEPALRDLWVVLTHHDFHRFVATLLYEAIVMNEEQAEDIIQAFSEFMRGRDDAALWALLETNTPRHPFLADVGEVVKAYRKEILEERARAHAMEDVRQFVLDLTSTSLPTLLRSFSDWRRVKYRVVLDDSRAMRLAAPQVRDLLEGSQLVISSIEFERSEASAALQIADLAAGVATYVFREGDQHEMFVPTIVPSRLGEYNLMSAFVEPKHLEHNGDVLNMIANNLRAGRDPAERLKTILEAAIAIQQQE